MRFVLKVTLEVFLFIISETIVLFIGDGGSKLQTAGCPGKKALQKILNCNIRGRS